MAISDRLVKDRHNEFDAMSRSHTRGCAQVRARCLEEI
jgi:hypothetical protein